MASTRLGSLTRTELAALAQRHRIPGWKGLKKDELIEALGKLEPTESSSSKPEGQNGSRKKPSATPVTTKSEKADQGKTTVVKNKTAVDKGKAIAVKRQPPKAPKTSATDATSAEPPVGTVRNTLTAKSRGKRNTSINPPLEAVLKRDLARAAAGDKDGQDRFVLLVRDPYWLQAVWEFSRGTIQRAEVALGSEWHRSVPILRVMDVSGHDATSRSEARLLDIPIHGGVNYWYVPIDGQPRTYRLQIGYLAPNGRFQVLARSNSVTPPRPGTPGTISGGWDDLNGEYQRVFALSGGYSEASPQSPVRELLEDRLGRPIDAWNAQGATDQVEAAASSKSSGQLPLTFHAELILHGITSPDARVTVVDEPAHVKRDGSFQVRLGLEDGRHLIQTVVSRPDGSGQRTIILSVERNTKELEAQGWESGD